MPILSNWSQGTPNIYSSLCHIYIYIYSMIDLSIIYTCKIYKYRENVSSISQGLWRERKTHDWFYRILIPSI